jgi:hypothetical protein
MSKKTKTTKAKAKKENLAALGLPALWERFKEATGETTKSPNKKFLVRRIEEALAARAAEPAPAEEPQRPTRTSARATPVPEPETTLAESTPPKARGRFASMTIEELQTMYLEIVGRSTGSDDRRYLIWKIREAEKGRINVGPRKTRARDGEPLDVKVLPLRLEADTPTPPKAEPLAEGAELLGGCTNPHRTLPAAGEQRTSLSLGKRPLAPWSARGAVNRSALVFETDCLDVVSLGTEHERGVIGVVVLGPNAWTAVVLGAGAERCRMEGPHSGSRWGSEADVSRRRLPAVVRHPEGALAPDAEPDESNGAALLSRHFAHDLQSQRRESLRVKVLGAFEILDGQGDVVDHQVQLGQATSISRFSTFTIMAAVRSATVEDCGPQVGGQLEAELLELADALPLAEPLVHRDGP